MIKYQKIAIHTIRTILLLSISITIFSLERRNPEPSQGFFLDIIYKYNHLTYIAILLTTIIAIAYYFIKKYRIVKKIYFLFLPPIFSINIAVTVIYWTLYNLNAEYVHSKSRLTPESKDHLITNLFKHGFPMVLTFIDMLFLVDIKSKKIYYLLVISFTNIYMIWCYFCKIFTKSLPYGFLKGKGFLFVFMFFNCCAILFSLILLFFFLTKSKIQKILEIRRNNKIIS